MPEVARHGAREGVLGGHQQELAAGLEDAGQLQRPGRGSGRCSSTQPQMMASKAGVRVRQAQSGRRRESGCDRSWNGGGPLEHAVRQIEGVKAGIGVGPAEDIFAVPAAAATGVQDALAAAQIEGAIGFNTCPARIEWSVNTPDSVISLPAQPVVMVLDEAAIFRVGLAAQAGLIRSPAAAQRLPDFSCQSPRCRTACPEFPCSQLES